MLTTLGRLKEMINIPRNRNAAIAAGMAMFGQQFCGVNVIGTSSLTVLASHASAHFPVK